MGSLNSPLGITSSDGTWNYADPKALAHATTTPVFGVNGDRDLFCPPAGGARLGVVAFWVGGGGGPGWTVG